MPRTVFGFALVLALSTSAGAAPEGSSPQASAPAATSGDDWPLLGGNAGQWQFSPLKLINDRNVAQLGLLWSADLPIVQGLVGNPLVLDGTVYQGAPGGRIVANDVRSGKLLWTFEPPPRSLD